MKKIKIIIILAILITSTSLIGYDARLVSAQSTDNCVTGMIKYFDGEDGKSGANKIFRDNVEKHFKNKSSNSSLLQPAIQLYEKYKQDAKAKYSKYAPKSGISQDSNYYEQNQCYYEMTNQIANAKKILMNDIKLSSYKKKQTVLIEKYDAISSGLRKLNMSFAEMQAFFQTLRDKLPKFIKDCL